MKIFHDTIGIFLDLKKILGGKLESLEQLDLQVFSSRENERRERRKGKYSLGLKNWNYFQYFSRFNNI